MVVWVLRILMHAGLVAYMQVVCPQLFAKIFVRIVGVLTFKVFGNNKIKVLLHIIIKR
jgi:hypothetical protein